MHLPCGRFLFIYDDDLVDAHAQNMCEDNKIVDGGHSFAAHPFENGLRRIEAVNCLYFRDFQPVRFDERLDV